MKFMKDRQNFIDNHFKQHNLTSIGDVDMYGASAPSYGQGGNYGQGGSYGQGGNINQGGSFNQGGSTNQGAGNNRGGNMGNTNPSMNTSSGQLLFTTPSEARPSVVSSSSCCCSVM